MQGFCGVILPLFFWLSLYKKLWGKIYAEYSELFGKNLDIKPLFSWITVSPESQTQHIKTAWFFFFWVCSTMFSPLCSAAITDLPQPLKSLMDLSLLSSHDIEPATVQGLWEMKFVKNGRTYLNIWREQHKILLRKAPKLDFSYLHCSKTERGFQLLEYGKWI